MRTRAHLISAPWADLFTPSIQLGALKAFHDQHPVRGVEVSTHSAFAAIPLRVLARTRHLEFRTRFAEFTYGLLLMRRHAAAEMKRCGATVAKLVRRLNASFELTTAQALTPAVLDILEEETVRYTTRTFRPGDASELMVYGFTLNYDQVTSSLFMAKQIFDAASNKANVIFVFGGMSAADPASVQLIKSFDLPAFGVLGEGEQKLQQILARCGASATATELKASLPGIQGVYAFADPPDLWVKDKAMYEQQISDISRLPVPDFREYYAELHRHYRSDKDRLELHKEIELPVEGSRGCFAKCTFCGLNYLWQGFRKMPATAVMSRVQRYQAAYPLSRLKFVDNVCDTWAEAYADELLEVNARIPSFMELRAHHGETFWTKLSLAGVNAVQIGTEALSANVLKLIQKGTTVSQNVLAHKYLGELGIDPRSNLITHYPESRPEDAEETRQVLEKIIHLPMFSLTPFVLSMGSRVFETLTREERLALVPRGSNRLPAALARFSLEYGYEIPSRMLTPEAREAWDELWRWYRTYTREKRTRGPVLTCETLPDGQLRIVDSRFLRVPQVVIYPVETATIYELCHAGKKREELVAQSGLGDQLVTSILDELVARSFVHMFGERCVALATRARDELVCNYVRARVSQRPATQLKLLRLADGPPRSSSSAGVPMFDDARPRSTAITSAEIQLLRETAVIG